MTTIHLAFAHLNLRWNPFGEIGFDDIAQLAVVHVDQYVDRLRRPGFALQFMGDPGCGKTTHLVALHSYFPSAPYIHFKENEKIPAVPLASPLFLDETQRLPPSLRRRFFSRKASFVIGTHVDHSSEYKRAGLSYESIHLKGLSVERLAMILEHRIEWARRDPGPVPTISIPAIAHLIDLYGDDLSAILSRLYDEFQSLEEITDVKIYAPGTV